MANQYRPANPTNGVLQYSRQTLTVIAFVLVPALTLLFPIPGAAGTQPASEPMLGFHVSRGDATHMQAVRAAGGKFAVIVMSWADIEPVPNYFYWEKPDSAVRAGEYYGVQIVARLDRPPDWALDSDGPTPWDLDAYAAFVRRVAERYGNRLGGIILWNEPNLSLEWNGQQPDPASYVAMLRSAYPAAKAAARDIPVLMGGLAATLGDDIRATNELEFLEGIYDAGGRAYFDGLAAHPYGFGQPPDQPPSKDRLNFRRLELQRAIMEANGDAGKPVWITEMGWRTSAPDASEAWQVVSPQQQADFTIQGMEYAAESYPWLERIGLWELNGEVDDYGYGLWRGPGQETPAYRALVVRAEGEREVADDSSRGEDSQAEPLLLDENGVVEILAADVAIRLGDIGTLHPHWVHLYRGGENFSPEWEGEFFLAGTAATGQYRLLLETMQVDQPSNRVFVNGAEIGRLSTRSRPDVTSTWVTQRLAIPRDVLRPGLNTLRVTSGRRNPAHQYGHWRWENLQFRHARLVPTTDDPVPLLGKWELLPSPGGWSETNRLRVEEDGALWLTGNRPGELWRQEGGTLRNMAADRPDLVFVDVLPAGQGTLAATDHGLLWLAQDGEAWQPVARAPLVYAYVVARAGNAYYAGFEGQGLWRAVQPQGPWQPYALTRRTALDLAVISPQELALATDSGVFLIGQKDGRRSWKRLPVFPEVVDGERHANQFAQRLFLGREGELIVRHKDQLWRWDEARDDWQPFGPPTAEGRQLSVAACCLDGTLVGTDRRGLWRLVDGTWQRLDDGCFDGLAANELHISPQGIVAATDVGLFTSEDGRRWRASFGLKPTIGDLIVDPEEPMRWIAATPAGVYRSKDGGRRWQLVSPPWMVWDMTLGPEGRLFLARSNGVAWTDDLRASPIPWQEARGMESVLFFSVNPHPQDPAILWAGSWGNNVGVSQDGGRTLAPLHNGLETLSALDVLWHPAPGPGVWVDPDAPEPVGSEQVTIATIEGLYRTDDGGQSWFKLPGPLEHQTVHRLLQTGDGTLWAGAADGLWYSGDYGTGWERVDSMVPATVLRLGILPVSGDGRPWLWAGTEGDGLWLSDDGGATWLFGGLAGDSVYNVLLHPTVPSRLVAATQRGILEAEL